MAGIGSEAVTPIRPDLATNLTPINFAVEQNAVSALSDAFRQGVITSDDIIQRYGTLAKSKEKMQIQGIDEFLSPDAIAARQAQSQLLGEKTKSEIALLPIEEQTKRAQLEATRIAAEQGDNAAVRKFSIEHGFGPFLSQVPSGGSYTAENAAQDRQVYQDAVRYEQAIKGADGILKDIDPVPNKKEFTDKFGATTSQTNFDEPILVSKTGAGGYQQEQAQKAGVLRRMTPQEWVAAGRPTVGEFVLGVKPAEKPAEQATTLQPVNEVVTPRQTTETTTTKPDGTVTVTRKVVEPTSHPNAPTSIEDLKPGQSYKAAKADDPAKALTDLQSRAKQAVELASSAERGYAELEKAGYNLTDWTATGWEIANKLPVPEAVLNQFRSPERQKFEQAIVSFDEGFLRLASGAAISVGEHKTYRRMFWPMPGDSPSIVKEKKRLRSQVAASAAQISAAGGKFEPGSPGQKIVQETYDRALAIENSYSNPATSTQAGRPTMEPEVRHDLSSGKGQVIKRGGRYTVAPSTNSVPVVTPLK